MNTTQAKEAVRATETELARLKQTAILAEREATNAQTAFEGDPSEQAFMAASVAKQRARNARGQAERYERTEVDQAREALKEAEHMAVEAELQAAEDSLNRKLDNAVDALFQAIEAFDAARDETVSFEATRARAKSFAVSSSFSLASAMHVRSLALNRRLGGARRSSLGKFTGGAEEPMSFSVDGLVVRFRVMCGFPVEAITPKGSTLTANDESASRFDA